MTRYRVSTDIASWVGLVFRVEKKFLWWWVKVWDCSSMDQAEKLIKHLQLEPKEVV